MPPHPTPEQVVAIGQTASRWGLASVLVLFLVGAALFYFVDEEKGRAERAHLVQ
jgi:cbb3-type cytochrome oxidase subunit 3